jgi:prefoldin subunit 5
VHEDHKVFLWLGAGVLMEYDIKEAKKLLSDKLESVTSQLETAEEDAEFLRNQITVMEVSILFFSFLASFFFFFLF